MSGFSRDSLRYDAPKESVERVMGDLKGKTMFLSGGSRGIGLAIAKRAAKDGANIIIAAKTAEPHPKLPGTIYSAAAEIEEAGSRKSRSLMPRRSVAVTCTRESRGSPTILQTTTVRRWPGFASLYLT